MRFKLPWIDRTKCDIAEHCGQCRVAESCPTGAFHVLQGPTEFEPDSACRTAIDFELCKQCGDCSHTCEHGAVKMV